MHLDLLEVFMPARLESQSERVGRHPDKVTLVSGKGALGHLAGPHMVNGSWRSHD